MNDSEKSNELFKYSLYIGEGLILAIVNAIIVLAILNSKALRRNKEYIIVGGLALADMWNALGYFTAGCYRTYLISTNQHTIKVTPWACMKTVHNFFFIIGEPLSGIFLSAVSLDRLLSVCLPFQYFKWGRSHGYRLTGAFYLYAVVSALVGVAFSYSSPRKPIYGKLCFTGWALHYKSYRVYYYGVRTVGAILSVLLYVLVVMVYCWKNRKRQIAPSNINNSEIRRLFNYHQKQIRLMKTVGISSFFTFLFAVLPNSVMTVFSDRLTDDDYASLAPYVLSVGNLNPLMNIFLYTFRHKDMREAIWALCTCKPGYTPSIKGKRKVGVVKLDIIEMKNVDRVSSARL